MQYCTTSCTRCSHFGSIWAVDLLSTWKSQAQGSRTALKPRFFIYATYSAVIGGLPQPVSPPGASRVLPMFQPTVMLLVSCIAVLVIPVESGGRGETL